MNKSITIVFGGNSAARPTGGGKICLEYANRLAADGWDVCIVNNFVGLHYRLLGRVGWNAVNTIKYYYHKARNNFPAFGRWFNLDPRVRVVHTRNIRWGSVPRTALYMATSGGTAPFVNTYPIPSSRKFYFIQGYEAWGTWDDAKIRETYHYPMTKMVVSTWLQRIVGDEEHEPCVFIPNAFDFDYFRMSVPPEKKNKYSVSLLYHTRPEKGLAYSLEALRKVKKEIPQLKAKLFGACPPPADLADWMEYFQQPDQDSHNRIYNESAIFIGASTMEGWGLTIGEAMMCGAAIACTDNDGFKEMVTDGETGLLSPVKDSAALADNILRLIRDDALRIRLAYNGYHHIQQFNWERSCHLMNETLMKGLAE